MMKSFKKIPAVFLVVLFGSMFALAESANNDFKNTASNKIAFKFVKNQIVLAVSINGRGEYNMLLDTGVIPSAIDFELAKELGLPIDEENAVNVAGRGNETRKIFPAKIKNLTINNQNFGDIDAMASPFIKHLSKPLGMELHGILGYSLLKDKILQIDYQNKTVEFFEDRQALNKTLAGSLVYLEKFTFEDSDIIPTVRGLKINGQKFIASIDTGSSLSIEIFSHNLGKLKLTDFPDKDKKEVTIIGAQGKDTVFDSKVELVKLGSNDFEDQEITIASVKNTNQTRMGNIGNKFLQNFVFSIDYTNKEVMLKRVKPNSFGSDE